MILSLVGIFGFVFASFKSARMTILKFRADFSQVLSVEGFQMVVRGAVRPHRPFTLPRTPCGVPCGRMVTQCLMRPAMRPHSRPHRPFGLSRMACGLPCGRMLGRMVARTPFNPHLLKKNHYSAIFSKFFSHFSFIPPPFFFIFLVFKTSPHPSI